MKFASKRAFSLLEVMIVVYLVSVGILWLIVALNKGLWFVQQTREKVLSVNLAKEWMEQMFNIRDTNRVRRAGQKEECWLKEDPLDATNWNPRCSDDAWMQSGTYAIVSRNLEGQEYFALSGYSIWLDIDDDIQASDLNYALCKQNDMWTSCPWVVPSESEWRYFRQVTIKGLYDKSADVPWWLLLDCDNWEDNPVCSNGEARELRFCVEVAYVGRTKGSIELCGLMTNFYQ